ncbi:MAG: hypothetical protein RR202_10975 [Bacteroidales bacterium]
MKMRCFYFLLIIFAFNILPVKGQKGCNKVQIFEGDIRAILTTPLGGHYGGTAQISGCLGIKGRYNFKNTPWDCGLMLELSTARRRFNHIFDDNFYRWQNNRSLAIAITSNYNLRQETKVNPFGGIQPLPQGLQ